MSVFKVTIVNKAEITLSVEAEDEGQAYDKARELAYDADKRSFIFTDELESRVNSE